MFKFLIIISVLTFALSINSYSASAVNGSTGGANYSLNNSHQKDITFPPVRQHELFHVVFPAGNAESNSSGGISLWDLLNPIGFINSVSALFY